MEVIMATLKNWNLEALIITLSLVLALVLAGGCGGGSGEDSDIIDGDATESDGDGTEVEVDGDITEIDGDSEEEFGVDLCGGETCPENSECVGESCQCLPGYRRVPGEKDDFLCIPEEDGDGEVIDGDIADGDATESDGDITETDGDLDGDDDADGDSDDDSEEESETEAELEEEIQFGWLSVIVSGGPQVADVLVTLEDVSHNPVEWQETCEGRTYCSFRVPEGAYSAAFERTTGDNLFRLEGALVREAEVSYGETAVIEVLYQRTSPP